MAINLNTNIASLRANNVLTKNNNALEKSHGKFSSGSRINSAGDDAAGLSIADRMQSQRRGFAQAIRNAADGISIAQTADGALNEYVNIVQTIRTKAIQAANDTNSAEDKKSIQAEINQLLSELKRISKDTVFNNQKLLNGDFFSKKLHIGAEANQTIDITIPNCNPEKLGHTENLPLKTGQGRSEIVVDYEGFSNKAKKTFEYAKNIWEETLGSKVEIKIDASMSHLPGNALGGSYPTITEDFKMGKTMGDTWYTWALANAIMGKDVNVDFSDITIELSNSPDVDWYYGTDGKPGEGQYDFASVVIHEIGHGLGFNSAVAPDGSWYWTGNPAIFDTFVKQSNSDKNLSEMTEEDRFYAIRSNDLVWSGTHGVEGNDDKPPAIYAPFGWKPGSSVSHLDIESFPPGDKNSLMTPYLAAGKTNHRIGPVSLGMFQDMGWSMGTNKEGLIGVNVLNYREAMQAINSCDMAIGQVDVIRGRVGAMHNRLAATISNLTNSKINITAAESVIKDLDYAQESGNLSRLNVLKQSGMASATIAGDMPGSIIDIII